MTPLEVAQGMANFLKERLAEYEERGEIGRAHV